MRYVTVMLLLLLLFSCNTGAGDRDMTKIMERVQQRNDDKDNPFRPGKKILYLDSMISTVANSNYRMSLQYSRANLLLQTGDEKQSFAILEQMLGQLHTNDMYVNQQMLKSYGMAALRLGERQNCVLSHAAESCLMPVQGTGVHRIQDGSLQAIKAYTALLKMNAQDLEARWLLNIAYMTLGQYPSGVPVQWLIPGLDKDSAAGTVKPFSDIAPKLKLDIKNLAGGMIVDDFNNDGYMDVVNSQWDPGAPMHYFKNDGNGNFIDISSSSGLSNCKGGLNIVQADYDNDGFTDILVLRGGWMPGKFGKQPNSLLRNNGDDTFTDVTLESGLFSLHPTQTAVWRDFNNDGWLDIFIGNETTTEEDPHPCELFINNGHGAFKNIAPSAACNILGFVKGVASADYNNDGLMDIFISTSDGRRMLLKNTGIQNTLPHFEDVTHAAGLDRERVKTFPTWFWDYDNDGWPDIFVSGYQPARTMAYTVAAEALHVPDSTAGKMYLYHNNHDGTFSNVTKEAGLYSSVFAMGANFGDIDNDGYLDMYLGTGNPEFGSLVPNRLFKNIAGKRFSDVTVSARVGNLQKGHGVAFSDIDNDGDQDIFIEVGGAYPGDGYYNSLYMNPGQNNNHWIYIDLVGKGSNRSAIGSRIKISFKENGVARTVYRDVNSGGSFGSSPLRREIGIGQAVIIDEITVLWAGSNAIQTFKNIGPDQCIKIIEGNAGPAKVPLKKQHFELNTDLALPCAPIVQKTANR